MPIIEGIEQQTAEWLQMRTGCVTGSRVADVMKKLKRGDGEAADRRNYKSEIVCEMLTGRAAEHFVTPAMEWGIDNESFAKAAYEVELEEIKPVGFALHPSIPRFGASPDGLVGEDGLVEIKCPTSAVHMEYIADGVVPIEYGWQMLAEMACAERKWCDFVSYDPRLPKKFQLFIRRYHRDDELIQQMEMEVIKFLEEAVERVKEMEGVEMIQVGE